jgi:uncharacterized protein
MQTNSNDYALITGATSGIGFEIAKRFAKDGHNLVLVARSKEGLLETASFLEKNFQISVYVIEKDLFVPGAAKEIHTETSQQGFGIRYLVNDAGQAVWGKFSDTDLDREIDLIHLNIIALMSLTKYYLKDMIERRQGRILQVASSLAKTPTPMMSVYAASKAFVLSFAEALISEIKGTDVTMTVLLPNATDTDFFHKSGSEHTVTYRETSLYKPEEVAAAAYEAMMVGEAKVIPGMKNKMQGAMAAVMSDEAVAEMMSKQMQPSEKEKGKVRINHPASQRERERINKATGDYSTHKDHVHEDSELHHPAS